MSATATDRRVIKDSLEAIDRFWGILEDEGIAANGCLVDEPMSEEESEMLLPELRRLTDDLNRLRAQETADA